MSIRKMLSIIMVVVMCLGLLSGCGEDKNTQTTTTTTETTVETGKTITLVSGDENIGFYMNLKKGAEDAAKKYGFTLEYIGIEDTEQSDAQTHISKLQTVLDSDTSGVVVTPMSKGYSDVFSSFYDKGIPVVQVDSIDDDDVEALESRNKNPIVATVLTDYKEAGAICAEKLFEAVKGDVKNSQNTFVIGVIERDDEDADKQKSSGFVEKFSELADADESTKGKYRIEAEDGMDSLEELRRDDVRAVFITHPELADKISDTVFADKEKYKGIVFCGFDSGAKQLNWLGNEEGSRFIGGVAQDSYNLGYNAVEQCIFSIQNKELKPYIEIQAHWYDKTNVDKMKQDNLIFEK